MAVPGTQRHCLTALHGVHMQDPKGREDVVLRIHFVWWHHHQAVGPLKRGSDQQEPWELVQTSEQDKRRKRRLKIIIIIIRQESRQKKVERREKEQNDLQTRKMEQILLKRNGSQGQMGRKKKAPSQFQEVLVSKPRYLTSYQI